MLLEFSQMYSVTSFLITVIIPAQCTSCTECKLMQLEDFKSFFVVVYKLGLSYFMIKQMF